MVRCPSRIYSINHGSDGTIMLYLNLLEPTEKVVHTDPTFAMYQLYQNVWSAINRNAI